MDKFISYIRGLSGWFLLLSCLVEIYELNANSVDPDQMSQNAASDLGLYCLPVFLLCLPVSFYGMLGLYGLKHVASTDPRKPEQSHKVC